jgi:hypothetical protein
MKKRFALVPVFFVLFSAVVTVGQQQDTPASSSAEKSATTTAPIEPEWPGPIFLLVEGKLIPIEGQRPTGSTKIKALGFGGGTFSYVYAKPASPTRIASGANPVFVMRLERDVNPETLVVLDQMQTSSDNRKIVTAKVGSMVKGFSGKEGTQNLELTFVRYGSTSAKFTIKKVLPKGEYAFRTASGITYMFGVD